MNRRDFIVKLPALFALPFIISQIGCDNSTNPTSSDNGNDEDSFKVTSSVNSGHSHTVDILNDDIENPSTNTLISSSTNHSHQITISTTDYQTLKDGGTIVKTSTTNGGHSHTFSIKVPQ